jgi:hypothetical protein
MTLAPFVGLPPKSGRKKLNFSLTNHPGRGESDNILNIPLTVARYLARMRSCRTCQHLKRPEIDRRLAAGEPSAQVARDYELNPSSLHRHRTNCLKLGSSSAIMKDTARGSAAVALLPSKETLSEAYFELRGRIDQIVAQAEQQGSLKVAISGLNSIRQTFDSLARLAGHDRAAGTQVNVAVQTNVNVGIAQISERLIQHFDHEPELKARIAQALVEMDDEQAA